MLFTDKRGTKAAFAKDPAVVHFGGRYLLYYSVYERFGERELLTVGIAESGDMENWEIIGRLPLTQECEANGIAAPAAYVENGNELGVYYQNLDYMSRDENALGYFGATKVDIIPSAERIQLVLRYNNNHRQ